VLTPTLTLVQFDTESTDVVHESMPILEVPDLNHQTFQPRGGTPLLDALGQTIDSTGRALAAIPEANRPNKVVFVVITDGQENSSHQHTKTSVKERIDHQSSRYNWQFVFLGANQDALMKQVRWELQWATRPTLLLPECRQHSQPRLRTLPAIAAAAMRQSSPTLTINGPRCWKSLTKDRSLNLATDFTTSAFITPRSFLCNFQRCRKVA
jgi:hypothetical protein